jgi:hypothetical protein
LFELRPAFTERIFVRFNILVFHQAYDKIEKNEMGGACSSDEVGERHVQGLGWRNLRERDHWEDPDVDERIILRWIFKKWMWGYGMD